MLMLKEDSLWGSVVVLVFLFTGFGTGIVMAVAALIIWLRDKIRGKPIAEPRQK